MTHGRKTAAALAGAGAVLALLVGGPATATASTSATEQMAAGDDALSMAKITKLVHNKVVERKKPGADGHWYSFQTTTPRWAVVAVKPSYYLADVDLVAFDDKAQTEQLAESEEPGGFVDFVAIDSNHRALGEYGARVEREVGFPGLNSVQVFDKSTPVGDGTFEVDFDQDRFVAVRDTYLTAGTTYRFVYAPHQSNTRGSIYIMASDPGLSATWVQIVDDAVTTDYSSMGEAAIVDFTPSRSDWYGLVLTNTYGDGTYTLARAILP